jgi:hypothetical protein
MTEVMTELQNLIVQTENEVSKRSVYVTTCEILVKKSFDIKKDILKVEEYLSAPVYRQHSASGRYTLDINLLTVSSYVNGFPYRAMAHRNQDINIDDFHDYIMYIIREFYRDLNLDT